MNLKEILKPPYDDNVIGLRFESDSHGFCVGLIYPEPKFENDIMQFLKDALNEKWEREYGEKKRRK